jgi:predicted PurR-regulated permease PerM
MNQQKDFANIVFIILIVVLAGVVGYSALVKKSPEITQQTTTPVQQSQSNNQASQAPESPMPIQKEISDWETYTNTRFGFVVRYPKDWRAPEVFGGVNT